MLHEPRTNVRAVKVRRSISISRILGLLALMVCLARLTTPRACAGDAAAFHSAMDSIKADELTAHVTVLASDTFEGREAGTRGGKAAGAYLVEQLRKLDVQAAGTRGDFFQEFGYDYRNILVTIHGRDAKLAHEYVIVGAHYDHVGYGTSRNSRGPIGRIHNGADDNASGSAALLEVIEAFVRLGEAPRRSLLFVFWDAEEKGLLGSEHYVAAPTVPLDRIVLLLNCDMLGRMRENELEVYGVRTAPGLRKFVGQANGPAGPELKFNWDLKRESDHYPFFQRGVPVLMLHTGKHDDYHRPSDDVDRIDFSGIEQASRLLFAMAHAAAEQDSRPRFRGDAAGENETTHARSEVTLPDGPPRLGVSWDAEDEKRNVIRLTTVGPGSAAQRAGLQVGDVILKFAGVPIEQIGDLRQLVLAAPSNVQVEVRRGDRPEPVLLEVALAEQPVKWGIAWRDDPVEPGCVILTRVVRGSPADLAALRPHDRVFKVDGKPFAGPREFHKLMTDAAGPLTLLTERDGRILPRNLMPYAWPDATEGKGSSAAD